MATSKRSVTRNGFTVPNETRREHYFTNVCDTGKRGYLIRAAAKKAAKSAGNIGYGNMRAYKCDRCAFWHVGHSTQYNPRYKKD
jgi:hypothetical protein